MGKQKGNLSNKGLKKGHRVAFSHFTRGGRHLTHGILFTLMPEVLRQALMVRHCWPREDRALKFDRIPSIGRKAASEHLFC